MGTRLNLSASLLVSLALVAGCKFTVGPLDEDEPTVDGTTTSESAATLPGTSTSVPPMPTSSPPESEPSSSEDDGGSSSTGPAPDPTDCCIEHSSVGCGDPMVEACVCELDRFCCEEEWDVECVTKVDAFGCGECDPKFDAGDCCTPNSTPGCADPSASECVCALDDFCCSIEWDHVCVDLLSESGCGDCSAAEECCQVQTGPGCGSESVEACVCDARPECCEGQWDAACTEAVELLGCGFCPYSNTDSCCEPHYGSGCESMSVEECVCAKDQYCCEVQWDETCVDEVEPFGCGPCDAEGTGGDSTGTETGTGTSGAT